MASYGLMDILSDTLDLAFCISERDDVLHFDARDLLATCLPSVEDISHTFLFLSASGTIQYLPVAVTYVDGRYVSANWEAITRPCSGDRE